MKSFFTRALLGAACVLLGASGAAQATVYYVDGSRPDNSGDGLSWATAKKDVQPAINAATAAGDEVWVKAGTYLPTLAPAAGGTAQDVSFYLTAANIGLYGGFAGTETQRTQRSPAANPTVLSGDLDGPAGTADAYHVVLTSARGSACVLDGFTVQGGQATGSGSFNGNMRNGGGGMFNSSSSPTVSNCTFSGNAAGANGGGGMYNSSSSSSPVVSNCTFSGNTSGSGGGGMFNSSSSPTVSNCTFSGNAANNNGGGMYNSSSSSSSSGSVVSNCTFSGNTSGSGGGGMFNSFSSPTVSNCTFSDNSAGLSGGAINTASGTPSFTNCTFYRNQATGTASLGGGLNYGSQGGGTLTNCIVADNTTPLNFNPNRVNVYKASNGTTSLTVNYCLISDFYRSASNNYNANFVFATLARLANPANLIGPDNTWRTADDGLALQGCSLAIDAGTAPAPATDIVGNPRVNNVFDLGAYEYQGSLTGPGTPVTANAIATETAVAGTSLDFGSCAGLAALSSTGASPVSGSVTLRLRLQATAGTAGGQPAVRRTYDVAPAANAGTATATLTFYYTQADFDDYNANRGTYPPLPTDAADAAGNAANLRVRQEHGTSATGAPGTYGGYTGPGPATEQLTPSSVVYNATLARWEVTVAVTGFSGFFAQSVAAAPLPVELTAFTAEAAGPAAARLAWTTASEKNSARFEVERSADGESFAKVGEVAAAGSSSVARTYAYPDAAAPAGLVYYRLRQVDRDGTASYSPVRTVSLGGAEALALAPNPARTATLASGLAAGAAVDVYDALGRPVLHTRADAAGQAVLALPAGLAPGLYVVRSGAQAARLVVE